MVELTVLDVLLILLWVAALALAVTAPGWIALGAATYRRRAARGPGGAWSAGIAGAVLGALLSGAVVAALAESVGTTPAVAAAWLVCWAVAVPTAARRRRSPAPAAGRGWGR